MAVECGQHKFILNTTTFCLFGQENVDITYLSLIRQRFVCLVRRMWTSHIYLKYDNILFVWSGECGDHIFIFNTTTFCLFGQENVDSTLFIFNTTTFCLFGQENDHVLFVWSGECGHHIFIFNTTTFCLFGQENVDITYLSLIR